MKIMFHSIKTNSAISTSQRSQITRATAPMSKQTFAISHPPITAEVPVRKAEDNRKAHMSNPLFRNFLKAQSDKDRQTAFVLLVNEGNSKDNELKSNNDGDSFSPAITPSRKR